MNRKLVLLLRKSECMIDFVRDGDAEETAEGVAKSGRK